MEATKEKKPTAMEEYQQVVATEKEIYDKKIESLNAFMREPGFEKLPPRVRVLLSSQFCTMAVYSFILGEIIQELE